MLLHFLHTVVLALFWSVLYVAAATIEVSLCCIIVYLPFLLVGRWRARRTKRRRSRGVRPTCKG